MKQLIKKIVGKAPPVKRVLDHKIVLQKENDSLREANESLQRANAQLEKYRTWAMPGHFNSPIPDIADIKKRAKDIFKLPPSKDLVGIDINEKRQLELLKAFRQYYPQIPFSAREKPDLRFYYVNDWFSYGDAIALYSFIRHFRPKRIIEAGSGFSSAAILDINDRFFDGKIKCSFVEPYTERLKTLLRKSDAASQIVEKRVELIDLKFFDQLQENDILFIDSSHISKTGSDLNTLLLEVLPRLNKGVLIHFHDVFYPFEYPKVWVYDGHAWNEDYMLRAFLTFNEQFSIEFFSSYLSNFHADKLNKNLPDFMKLAGGSLWLRRN
ncbi:MAG: class I SAM-dependent methyltransferase [Candidatus Saccharimonadales bacterium]